MFINNAKGEVELNSEHFFTPQNDYVITHGVVFVLSWEVNSALILTYSYEIDEEPSLVVNVTGNIIEILYPSTGSHATLGTHVVLLHVSNMDNETQSDSVRVTIIKAYTEREDFDPYSNRSTTEPEDAPWTIFGTIIGMILISNFLRIYNRRIKS